MIDKDILIQLQNKQLEVMDELHKICILNSIEYYIIGGTLLGSVRHSGFIPWDVDIDVAMTRCNYEKFKAICNSDKLSSFSFVNYEKDPYCHTNHGFFCKKYTSIESVGGGAKYGVFVDIFPLDNAPLDKKLQQKQAKAIKLNQKIVRYIIQSFRKSGKHASLKFLPKLCLRLFSKVYTIQFINKKLDKIMMKYDMINTPFLCSMCSHYSYEKQCMPKEVYGKPELVVFEDRHYFAPAMIDTYLKNIYGDYMKIPSKEEQEEYLDLFFKTFQSQK